MKALLVPEHPSAWSTTRYLHNALKALGVGLFPPDELAPSDDLLGSLVVQPRQLAQLGKTLMHPVAVVLNDRVTRHPPDWLRLLGNAADRVFCLNLPEQNAGIDANDLEWLPGAYQPGVHDFRFEGPHTMTPAPACYVGTFNAWRKWRFLRDLNVPISGDGWQRAPRGEAGAPKYGRQYAYLLSRARAAINIQQSRWGPNRKVFEIPHQALMLTEWVPGVDRVLHPESADAQWAFTTPGGLRSALDYYRDNPSEIEKHRREQVIQVEPYTYERQAKGLLKFFEETS